MPRSPAVGGSAESIVLTRGSEGAGEWLNLTSHSHCLMQMIGKALPMLHWRIQRRRIALVRVLLLALLAGALLTLRWLTPDESEQARRNLEAARAVWNAQGIDHYRIRVEFEGMIVYTGRKCTFEVEVQRTAVRPIHTSCRVDLAVVERFVRISEIFDLIAAAQVARQSRDLGKYSYCATGGCRFVEAAPPRVRYHPTLGYPEQYAGEVFELQREWLHPALWYQVWQQGRVPPCSTIAFSPSYSLNCYPVLATPTRLDVVSLEPIR